MSKEQFLNPETGAFQKIRQYSMVYKKESRETFLLSKHAH